MQEPRAMRAQSGHRDRSRQTAQSSRGAECRIGGSYLREVVPDALLLSAAILLIALGVASLGSHFTRVHLAPAMAVQRYFAALGRQDSGAALAQFSGDAALREANGPCAARACHGTGMRRELAALFGVAPPPFALEETSGSTVKARVWLADGSPHETAWQTRDGEITSVQIGPRMDGVPDPGQ